MLLYGSEVWEPFLAQDCDKWDYNEIEKTYLHFIKQTLGVNSSSTNILVRGETNRHSLQEEILRRNINYARYIDSKGENSIVKHAYNYELNRPTGQTSFFSTIRKHADKLYQLNDCFFPLRNPLENIYIIPSTKIKIYTNQIFLDIWKNSLENSNKGETYRRFKDTMSNEKYLEHLTRKERVALIKLRISDHKLMIEEGRRQRPKVPREKRTCKMCNTLEDEQHFLVSCKLYGSREHWLNQIEAIQTGFVTLL